MTRTALTRFALAALVSAFPYGSAPVHAGYWDYGPEVRGMLFSSGESGTVKAPNRLAKTQKRQRSKSFEEELFSRRKTVE